MKTKFRKNKFRVTIDDNITCVNIDDFYSGIILESDDYNGRKGLAVEMAIRKLYENKRNDNKNFLKAI